MAIRVTLADGTTADVEPTPFALVMLERRHGGPLAAPGYEDLAFVAHTTLRQKALIPAALDFEDFLEQLAELRDADTEPATPTGAVSAAASPKSSS